MNVLRPMEEIKKKHISSVLNIIELVSNYTKKEVTLKNNADSYISLDPILANFVNSPLGIYYIDFFVPKVRTIRGDYNYFHNLHKRSKDYINYIHFNKVGLLHHFYKKNEKKQPGIGKIIYQVLSQSEYVSHLLIKYDLKLDDLNKSYYDVMNKLK